MIVYKYLKKKHFLKFKEEGLIRVNTLYDLRSEYETIRDDLEGRAKLTVAAKKPLVYSGGEFQQIFPQIKSDRPGVEICLEAGAAIVGNKQVSNAFVFCASLKLDDDLFRKFEYDAYYRITEPDRFAEILWEEVDKVRTIRCFKADKVRYSDKEIVVSDKRKSLSKASLINDFWNICFTKPLRFRNEEEYRIVFVPEFPKEIAKLDLCCPELRKCCTL
jgi:hypothetical protein